MDHQKLKSTRTIQPVVTIRPLKENKGDFTFWQTQPYALRIAALEEIRQEYAQWRHLAQPGFQRVFGSLNDNQVRYLVVGGYAVALHGYPRYTKDIDIWIDLAPDNAQNLVKALDQFGFSSLGLKEGDFLVEDQIIQLGYAPNRIDILTTLPGVNFVDCYPNRVQVEMDGIMVNFIDLDDLRTNKKAFGRLQDLADLENLE